MANIHHRDQSCRLCHGSSLDIFLPMVPTPIAETYLSSTELDTTPDVYPLDLYICEDCHNVQLVDIIDPVHLWRDFQYLTSSTPGLVKHFHSYSQTIIEYMMPERGDLAVEIGSNDGTMLTFFKEAGLRTIGIDPAIDVAHLANSKGIYTIDQFVSISLAQEIRKRFGPANIVIANNVFAHADDMSGMLRAIQTLLSPDGCFFFEASYLVDLIEKMLIGTIFHEHICYHSLLPLTSFFKRHDLQLIDVKRVNIQGGSIIGTVQHDGGSRPTSNYVTELLDLETTLDLSNSETIKIFNDRFQSRKGEIYTLMHKIKTQNKTVAGYGASRSSSTLIAQFLLGPHLIFIVDDNPKKHGLYTVADQIPILPVNQLKRSQPDYVIILAWVHTEKIIDSNQHYLSAGGKFITLYPTFDIVTSENGQE